MKKILGFDELLLNQPYKLFGENLPKVGRNNFFLSFTDSLKYLLNESGIKKTDTLLLPDFYCPETAQEISKYAKVIFYRIKPNLSVDKTSYFAQIHRYKPRVIINYNFTGFTLTEEEKEILKKQSWNPILIDDCAHRILEDKNISFLTKNHFYIDSVRKYSPFLGSHLIHPEFKPKNVKKISIYKAKVISLQILLQALGHIAIYCKSKLFDSLGEYFFNIQDSIVGLSSTATSGDSLSYQLWRKLDLSKIKDRKKELAMVYYQQLYANKIPFVQKIALEKSYLENLVYFPLLVDPKKTKGLIKYLNDFNIFASEMWEVPSTYEENLKNQLYTSLIVLPLSSAINKDDALYISNQIKKYLTKSV